MSKENAYDVRAKYRFVRRLLCHRFQRQPRVCPYCGPFSGLKRIRRKKLVMDILQCDVCHLVFRWPTDTPEENDVYYQNEFAGDTPQVILPTAEELQRFKNSNFLDSGLDITDKVLVLDALRPASRVLDFGCSWGYGTQQLKQRGFDAVGFEISRPRAVYGRAKLGLHIIDAFDDLAKLPAGSFDIIFSNHVVEHLPDIAKSFATLARLLNRNGFVFHVLPNFMGKKARAGYWLKWIGEDHPIAPAMPFFEISIPRSGLATPIFGSSPFDDQTAQALKGMLGVNLSTEGDELLVYAQKAAQ
jgi:2-polyprenyl-3-methyl-5-hydroxy-6-metoxy-1,4-benzoquinol methylase